MTQITLKDAERYVHAGLGYVPGEFDCGSLAVLVQKEVFGRTIDLPTAGKRATTRTGQAKDIKAYQPLLADKVEQPSTGDAVVMWGGNARHRRWHVGTAFLQDGEVWALHCADEARGVMLQRMSQILTQGMHLDGYYAWRAEPTVKPQISLALATHPMTRAVETRMTAAGLTIEQTMRAHDLHGLQWIVRVGGVEVPAEHWARTKVKPGQVLEISAVMAKQVLQLVAIVVLSYFTFGAGGLGAGGLFTAGGAIGGGFMAAAAVFVGGSMLISAALGPKMGSMGGLSTEQPPPTYALQGGRNRARPFEPLALVLGETKAIPDNANQPFAWFEGEDQYLSMMLHAGINCASVSNIKLGDSPLTNYEEVQVRQYGFPGGNADLPPVIGTSVDTVEGGLLDNPNKNGSGPPPWNQPIPAEPGPWVVRTTSVNTGRIELDLQGSVQRMNNKGKYVNTNVVIDLQFAPVGSELWSPLGDGQLTITNSGPKPMRRTLGFDVAPGQYDVRLRKVTANSTGQGDDLNMSNEVAWSTLKSYQPDTADYGGQPRIELKMKASGQLNGAPDEVNWTARAGGMPYWNGSAWVTVTEPGANGISNPGAQILMLLRGIYRPSDGRLIAGAGLPDSRIDIESLKAFMVRCAAKDFRHDLFLQDPKKELGELLESIASAGMGSLSRHSGRYGVIWFAEDQPIEGVINMATIRARSFSVDYDLSRTSDEFQLEYFDRDRSWTWQPVRVKAPGVETPQRTSRENVSGVTREAHAALLARWYMGQNIYGRKSISFEMDLEHLVFRRGSVIALSHDLTQWGYSGRLKAIATAGNSFTVTLDEKVPAGPSATRTLGLRLAGEQQMRVFPVSQVSADGRQLTVAQAWPAGATLPGGGTAVHDALWIYDFKATPGFRARVMSIEPLGGMSGARLTVAPETPEFWNYVWTGEYLPPTNNSLLVAELPVASNLRVTRARVAVGGGWEHELTATWDVVGSYDHAQVWAAQLGQPLEYIGSTFGTQLPWRVASDQTWSVEVRPFDALGRLGTRVAITFIDPSVDVSAVESLSATIEANGVLLRWNAPKNTDAIGWAATQIRMGLAGVTWETATPVFEGRTDSVNLGWLQAGVQVFLGVHINSAGDMSTPVSKTLEILPPAQPIVTGDVWIDQVELQWTPSQTTQPLRGYEVRVGPILIEASLLTVADAIGYVYTPPEHGTHMFWVTAIDRGGNRSAPGYVELTTLPHIDEALEELRDGLDDVSNGIINIDNQIAAINGQLADIAGLPDWDAAETYGESELAKFEGGLYRSLQDDNTNHPPATSPTWWAKIGNYASLGEAVGAIAAQVAYHDTRISELDDDIVAQAATVTTLTAQVGANTASVSTVSSAVATLTGRVNASYTLSIAAGNKIAGFRVSTDGATSDFVVLSDRFAWALPDGSGVKYPLVLGTIAGVPSFGFSGNMYVDGTIQARMIGVDQLRAEHIRSSELETRHFKTQTLQAVAGYFGVSANLLPNSKLVTMRGWTASVWHGSMWSGINNPSLGSDYRPGGENVFSMYEPAALGANPGTVSYWVSDWVAADPGKRYEGSVYTGAHRCRVDVYVEMQDGNGNWVGNSDPGQAISYNDEQGGMYRTLGAARRIYGFLVAPGNAGRVRLIVRKFGNKYAGGDSWLMATMPYLGVAGPYQTLPSEYSASGVGTVITPEGISTPSIGAISDNLGLVVRGRLVSTDGLMTVDLDNKSITMRANGQRVEINTGGFWFGPEAYWDPKLFFDMSSGQMYLKGTFTADALNAVNTINIAGQAVTTMKNRRGANGGPIYGGDSFGNWMTLMTETAELRSGGNGIILFAEFASVMTAGFNQVPGYRLVNLSTGAIIGAWHHSGYDSTPGYANPPDAPTGLPPSQVLTFVDYSPINGTNTYAFQTVHYKTWVTHSKYNLSILASHR